MARRSKRNRKIVIGLYTTFILSLAGSVCGTFAWYTYGQQIPVSYEGTSIGDYGSLQIGLECSRKLTDPERMKYSLEADYSIPGKYIYWATGSYTAGALQFICKANGFASDTIHPVTPGKYEKPGDPFRLRNNPTYLKTFYGGVQYAPTTDYIQLNLVFRYMGDEETHTYADNFNVFLTSSTPVSDTNLHEGIRIYVEPDIPGEAKTGYLINPNKEKESEIVTAGPLDLDGDGYYDSKRRKSGLNVEYEFCYGEVDGYNDITGKQGVESKDVTWTTPLDDDYMNPSAKAGSTFDANSKKGNCRIDKEHSTLPSVHYLGSSVLGDLVIAKPKSSYNNYAFSTITIFLEGWDKHVDNAECLKDFSFDLLFQATM